MPATENQKVIEQLPPCGANPALRLRVRPRAPKGPADDFHALADEDSSKLLVNLESRSRSRKRAVRSRSWSFQARLRAGCVTQSPAG